jgi:hypothetical protein
MKKITALLFAFVCYTTATAQFAARMEIKENIPGICDVKNVYVMFPMFEGQKEAECPVSKKQIEERLDAEVTYLKDSVAYEDKGMVNIIINCKGEVVKCEIDNKTKSSELDKEIVAVFNSLGKWKAGKLKGTKVDSATLWSFEIKKGKFSVN